MQRSLHCQWVTANHTAQRGCGVSTCGDIQNLTGNGPEQTVPADLPRAGGKQLYHFRNWYCWYGLATTVAYDTVGDKVMKTCPQDKKENISLRKTVCLNNQRERSQIRWKCHWRGWITHSLLLTYVRVHMEGYLSEQQLTSTYSTQLKGTNEDTNIPSQFDWH